MPVGYRAVVRFLLRGTKRVVVTAVGVVLLLAGLAGLVLPVLPGWLLIVAAFAVLATEYAWAHHALEKARKHANQAQRGMRSAMNRRRRRPETVIDLADPDPVDLGVFEVGSEPEGTEARQPHP